MPERAQNPFAYAPRWPGRWFGGPSAASRRAMIHAAEELLDVQPAEQILALGPAAGLLAQRLAPKTPRGFVAAVDASPATVREAERRNRGLIRAGRVEVRQAVVTNLPYAAGFFHKACAVDALQDWPTPGDDLHEIRRVLKHGGGLLLALRVKAPTRVSGRVGFTAADVEAVERLVRAAGFETLVEPRRQRGEDVCYVLARV